MDKLIQGIAAEGTIRCFATITTQTVAEATQRHKTSPIVSDAFGRTLTGTLLLGASLKDFDRLTVKIDGNGGIGRIVAEANAKGKVRGYVLNPTAGLLPEEQERLKVREIVGEGMFHVIREAGFEIGLFREPFYGSVPIFSGEIAEDFAYYLLKSEQIPSAVMLGVLLENHEPYVAAAGGVMLQIMPGANEHLITMIEDTIRHAPQLTKAVHEGAEAKDLLDMTLGVIEYEILDEKEVGFSCTCSWERAKTIIGMLEKSELIEMLEKDQGAVMDCHFCNEAYQLNEKDLEEIIARL